MSSSFYNYYLYNYTQCEKDTRFLSSWRSVAIGSHCLLVVTIPFYILTGYCILKKTLKSMESVKLALMHTHFWCCCADVLLCSLITPYFFFPSVSGVPLGLLRWLGVPTSIQTYLGIVTISWTMFSLAILFENRSSSIPENMFRLRGRTDRGIFYSVNLIIIVFYSIPVFLNLPDTDSAKMLILEEQVPCPTEEFFTSPVFVLASDVFWMQYIMNFTVVMLIVTLAELLFFAACCIYYLYFCTNAAISQQTRHSQQLFFVGMMMQIFVPLVFCVIPFIGFFYNFYSGTYNQTTNNVCVLIFCCHGWATSVVIVLVHRPYREYLFSFKIFRKSSDIQQSSRGTTEFETIL